MKAYYLIDGKRYLDKHMISERLGVSRDIVRGLLKNYEAEVHSMQNKKLYPVVELLNYAKQEISKYGKADTNA